MRSAISLAALALVQTALAVPFQHPPVLEQPKPTPTKTDGVKIPLFKRAGGGLTSEEGIVDWTAAQAHLARLWVKYERGIIAFQENVDDRLLDARHLSRRELDDRQADHRGRAEFAARHQESQMLDVNLEIIERAFAARSNDFGLEERQFKTNPTARPANPKSRPRSGPVSLTMFGNDLLWAGPVTIGTPGTSFVIDFDTGSADFWVPSVNCTASACAPHAKYNPANSKTSMLQAGSALSLTYGDGSATQGLVYTDTVTVAGLTANAQTIGAANSLSSDFGDDPMDGIMGMGFQSISQLNASPFFQTLVSQGAVPNPQFAFKLAQSGSELFLGGVNQQLYKGNIEWHSLVSQSYWVVSASVWSNTTVAASQRNMIVDTGTTVIVAPVQDALAMWSKVPGAASYSNGYYTFPCDAVPQISFQFDNGQLWTMSAEDLNLGLLAPGSSRCVGSIVGQDIGMSAWILGDAFLKNTYTVFDLNGPRVGFAQLA